MKDIYLDKFLRNIKAAICSLIVVFATFAIYPFSVMLSKNSDSQIKVSKKLEIAKIEKRKPDSEHKNVKHLEFSKEKSLKNSDSNIESFSISTPSNYGSFNVLKSETSNPFGKGDFQMFEFESNDTFDMKIFEVSELDRIPKRLSKLSVRYPKDMLERGIDGLVELAVFINEDGSVTFDKIISSTNESFKNAALEIIPKLLYEAPLQNGNRVRAKFILPIPFKIVR